MIELAALLLAWPAASAATNPPAAPPSGPRFTDVSASSGIELTPTSGAHPRELILEVKGGGLGLVDFDRDGDLDLFVPNGATLADPERGPGARLYRNDGGLRFTDVTETSGIRHTRWSFGVAVGDVDGDGFDDIFIACFGPDVLLRNKGDGTFEDISARASLADDGWSTSAAFADLDADGDLDLFVCRYLEFDPARPLPPASFKGMAVIAGPKGYEPARDLVYENLGDGRFAERSREWGFAAARSAFALNLAVLDFSGDGILDVYVGNDSQASHLFVAERGEGGAIRFADQGLRSGIGVNGEGLEQATMGVAVADVDGNGRPDLFTTNFSSDTNTLHLNLDGRSFDDRTNQFGLGAPSRTMVGWAAGFADFDHDADEDLFVVNGHVYPQATKQAMDSDYAQPPQLFVRDGRRFAVAPTAGAWTPAPEVGRTAVFADLDLDGDIDIVSAGLDAPIRVLRNDHDQADDWIVVTPRDSRPHGAARDIVGAVVELRPRDGGAVQRRFITAGGPFQSTATREAHFGAPPALGAVDIVVRFLDGTEVLVDSAPRGRRISVDRKDAE
jgi:hypothetical protein